MGVVVFCSELALRRRFSNYRILQFGEVIVSYVRGTWCSGITSASHAEGPGFNPQCVHAY